MNDIKRYDIRRISDAENLIRVAMLQGVTLNAEGADMILGYFEGHDYCLMADEEGATVRHDEQYEGDHSEDEPYSVQDAIAFCQDMNDDLLHEDRNEKYLSQLRRDKQILDALMEGRCCYACLSSGTGA